MTEYFNEYGNPPLDGEICKAGEAIWKIAETLFKDMIKDGASIVEIRAAADYVSGVASGASAETILRFQMNKSKQEREDKHQTSSSDEPVSDIHI